MYLDDQSAQLPGRNLDVYAADIERIEVLEGPQGTLFGAGAQAGVIRYITNKPKLDMTEAIVNAGYGYTAHGDPSTSIDATLNLPLIEDKLALRAVIYNDTSRRLHQQRAGHLHPQEHRLRHSLTTSGGVVPENNVIGSNNSVTGKAINPVTYQGIRLSGLYQINDDWNVLHRSVVPEHGSGRGLRRDAERAPTARSCRTYR